MQADNQRKRNVFIQLPDAMDDYFTALAKRRLTSKANVCREILLDRVRKESPETVAAMEAQMSEPKAA